MAHDGAEVHLETLVIHGGQAPDPTTGAVMPPVSLSSTYVQESPGRHKGFEYSRSHNPTRYALERSVAILEGSSLTSDLTHGGFAAWALGRLTGLPYSVVAHGSDVHRHRAMMKTKVTNFAWLSIAWMMRKTNLMKRQARIIREAQHERRNPGLSSVGRYSSSYRSNR